MVPLMTAVAGMDPHARQVVWDALGRMKSSTLLIGTESLEECAALSGRLCVLVDGCMEAIGSIESLLRRFAIAFGITTKCVFFFVSNCPVPGHS
jgi:ABC-type multidrug transport system ATPase subunit